MRKKSLLLPLLLSVMLATTTSCQSMNPEAFQPATTETSEIVKETFSQEESENAESVETTEQPAAREPILGVPVMSREDYPKVDGSTATLPLSQALYRLATGASKPEAESDIVHSKTTNAYKNLIYGNSDLVIAYEPADSIYEEEKTQNVELDIRPVGKDALVFLCNEGNPVKSLSQQQLVDIYSGKITKWSEVGGAKKGIMAFQRPSGSGSQTLMKNLVMKEVEMAEAPVEMFATEMGELIEELARYNNEENALGYSVYYYVHNMYNLPGLHLMEVDQVMPDNNSIRNGTYPYVNEFYVAVRKDEPKNSNAYRLFQWMTSDDGQTFVESMGYVASKEVKETVKLFAEDNDGQTKTLDIGENQKLVVQADVIGNETGNLIIDKDLNYVNEKKSYTYADQYIDLKEVNQPVIAADNESNMVGVIKFGVDEWIISPEYHTVEEWNDYYGTVLWGSNGELTERIFSKDGEMVFEIQQGRLEYTDDYIWHFNHNNTVLKIYDKHLTLLNTIDFTPYGTPQYYSRYDKTGIMWLVENGYVMWSEDGTDFFDSSSMNTDLGNPCALGKKWAAFNQNWSYFIYDREKKQVIFGENENEEVTCDRSALSFTVKSDGKTRIYDTNGEVMRNSDGIEYSIQAGDGYFGYLDDGQIIMEKESSGEKYTLKGRFYEGSTVDVVTNHVFLAQSHPQMYKTDKDNRCYLFNGERKLMEQDSLSYRISAVPVVTDGDRHDKIAFNDEGEILYVSSENETIHLATPSVVVVTRGNYLCILDARGECVLKFLYSNMEDD